MAVWGILGFQFVSRQLELAFFGASGFGCSHFLINGGFMEIKASRDGLFKYAFLEGGTFEGELAAKLWFGKVAPSREVGSESRAKEYQLTLLKTERDRALGALTKEQRDALFTYDMKIKSFLLDFEVEIFKYTWSMAARLLLGEKEAEE